MSGHNASSSDLGRARTYSARLARKAVPGKKPVAVEGYVRFPSPPAPEVRPPAPRSPESTTSEVKSWEELLEWCLLIHPADEAFVVDPEGFVIAQTGNRDLEQLERVGSQLMAVAERADEIEAGVPRLLSLRFDDFWLTGLSYPRDEIGYFIVGFIGPQPLNPELQEPIGRQVQSNLDRL